jgi:ATP-dependent helicase HrpA
MGADSASAVGLARAAVSLTFKHDPQLPISARREEIIAALQRHQVIIVAGDTGSGKSTQLPQYCLELRRGIGGQIAHTQPRRIAARALAARIADEVSEPLGRSVGFRVRFADQVSAATRLVLMTDGLLLAELSGDPMLRRYDTIIVDEAHERTLNVDLLMGVLLRLLPHRPDLKVIVTSATLDVERVAKFFNDAPIITVSGRSHPIEIRYREGPDEEDLDLPAAVLEAYQEIVTEPGRLGEGDVLVFLPGEREIRDVSELLERELKSGVEVLSLYSRLSWEQQSRIFQPGARQRIVLATNVAETSITVPRIRAVIDSGLARISRYSIRNRLQRLPIEPISRASADQRKGRCGRLGPGLCLRLYSEENFEQRGAFTEPEVLRTNLAALLLRLAAEDLGEAESFPFIDPPDSRAINDGYRLLQELQAFDEQRCITRHGRAMSRLPLDPRLARALLESQRFHAESELLAITAGLSVPDVRIGAADSASEEVFNDGKSEFSALLKLWHAYRKAREGPRRELRRWCKERQLSVLRLSEWDDVYTQVVDRARDLGIVAQRRAASYTGIHRALLAGFCTVVGTRGEDGVYLGTRGVHFHIFPGSPLARRRPRWIMAANIVETSRIFARRVAEIEPMWVEAAAAHLLKREFLEPDWNEEREEVTARERISFLGLILSANRVVNYGPIAPEESRRIFSREGLVYQRLKRRPQWLLENDAAVREAQRMEERLRSRDLIQNAEAFVEFYDRALPRQVSSAATLEHFSRHLSQAQRQSLRLSPEQIFARQPDAQALNQFPENAQLNSLQVPVEYRFAPGDREDGARLKIPLLALPALTRHIIDAAIPGLAAPRVEALLRSLPKEARRTLIPIGDSAARFLAEQGAAAADVARLKSWLKETRGIPESLIRFDSHAVPTHLSAQLTVMLDEKELARGSELAELRRRCAAAGHDELGRRARESFGLLGAWRRFELDRLPEEIEVPVGEGSIAVFATLAPGERGFGVRYEWSAAEAQRAWRDGSVRLARIMLERQARDLAKRIAGDSTLLLGASPYMSSDELIDTLLQLTFERACFGEQPASRVRETFEQAVESGRERLYPSVDDWIATLRGWLADAGAVRHLLDQPAVPSLQQAAEESRQHLRQLLNPITLKSLTADWLRQYPRYLKAETRRWQRNVERRSEATPILQELEEWSARIRVLQQRLTAELRWLPQLDELRQWLEEYRVSLYAQELKTLGPISAVRLGQRIAEIDAWLQR